VETVISKDGTCIAYDVYGQGKPVIMVGGTMNSRVFGPAPGAQLLGEDFAVYDYDRRGRGDSDDSQPYTPAKEVEDIAALVDVAGGHAALCGFSAGAALAMKAAIELGPGRITKLAMYEGPYTSDPAVLKEWQDYGRLLHSAIKSGDTDQLVMVFMKLVHAEDQADTLRKDEATWQKLVKLTPTLMCDYKVIGSTKRIPKDRLAGVKVPALVICGGNSGPEVAADTRYIASLMPQAISEIVPGQSHSIEPAAIAPILRDFFA